MSEATAAQIERREPLMKIRGLTKEFIHPRASVWVSWLN